MIFRQNIKTEEEIRLDLKDRKILHWLSEDARMPCTKIARKIGLSRDAVKYTIKKLERKGVIQGYVSVINITKLGYNNFHIFLHLNKLNKEIKDRLIGILKSHPFINVIIEFSGKYDLEVGVAARSIEELDIILTKVTEDISQYLQKSDILIISRSYERRVFPKSFLDVKEDVKIKKPGKESGKELKLDKADLNILQMLSKNSVQPLYEIGRLAGLSADAVNYRIKKMISRGVILKHIPIINYSAMGYTVYVVLMNIQNLVKEKENKLEYFLKNHKNMLWAVKTIGKFNLMMYICVKRSDELHKTLIQMRELFSPDITDYETLIAYEEYKYTYFPEICVEDYSDCI